MSAYVPPRGIVQWGWRSLADPPMHMGRSLCELGCCLDRRVMTLKAASAVETHRRQPHFVPVRVNAISSSSRRMLMAACILVLWAQKNGEFD